jgi:predicted alpha/beta superfamily hydrolase
MYLVGILTNKFVGLVVSLCLIIAIFISAKGYLEEYTSDFNDITLHSSILDEDRKLFIRLPQNYDKSKSYPLIIKTDGNFNLKRWDESISELSEKGIIKDTIIVAIPNLYWFDTRNRDLVPPFARKDVQIAARSATVNDPNLFGKADLFLEFIEFEVISFIEKNYSINDNRVLSGFSAGGSFVLYTILTKPNLFTGYFAFSPAAWYDDSVVVNEFRTGLQHINGKPLFLYLSIGADENDIITGSFTGLLSAIEQNAPLNFYSEYSYSEGAGHSENPYISVPKALKAYYKFTAKNQ